MKRKLLTLILVATMLLGCLAACGKTEQKESSEQKSSVASSDNSASKESSASKEPSASKESSVVEEKKDPTLLKVILPFNPQEDTQKVEDHVNKILVEKYNIMIDLELLPSKELQSRCELAIAANEAIDIIWVSNWSNKISGYISQDSLLPLDDLLANYGQGILEVAANYLPSLKINGATYAVPCMQNNCQQGAVFIQKDIFDKYGKITKDQIQKAKNADKTGKAYYELMKPFYDWCIENYPDLYLYDNEAIFAAAYYDEIEYTKKAVSLTSGVYVDNDYHVFGYHEEPFASYLRDRYEWGRFAVQEGYVQKDAATTTDTTAMLQANKFIFTNGNYQIGIEATLKNSKGIDWVAVPFGEITTIYNGPQNTALAIPITSKNPEAAMVYLNAVVTDAEVFNALTYGIEGEHYKKVSDNKVELIPDSGWNVASGSWKIGNTFLGWVTGTQDESTPAKQQELNASATPHFLDGFSWSSKNVKDEVAQVKAIFGEYEKMRWSDDYEKLEEERNKKLEAAGIQKIIDDAQKQVDEWRKANGK